MKEFKPGDKVRIRTPEDIDKLFSEEEICAIPYILLVEYGNKEGYIIDKGRIDYAINVDGEGDNPEDYVMVDVDSAEAVLERIYFIVPDELFEIEE